MSNSQQDEQLDAELTGAGSEEQTPGATQDPVAQEGDTPAGEATEEQASGKSSRGRRTTRRQRARPAETAEDPSAEASQEASAQEGSANEGDAPAEEGADVQQTPQRPARTGRTSPGQRARAGDKVDEPAVEDDVPSPRLRELYRNEIVPTMMREFELANPMQIPRIQKIVLNIGLGEALTNGRAMEGATRDLAAISGQKPIITRARKSIAGFKIREGNPIGTCVTLRGDRMYHFLDRLVNMALPRIRDFRGISRRGFDGRGNFSIGVAEQIIFPEIDYNQIDRIRGLQVTIATSGDDDAQAARLLELYGMPFVRES